MLAATGPADLLGFATDGYPGPTWVRHEHEVARWCRLVAAWGADCGPEDLRLRPRGRSPAAGGGAPGGGVRVPPLARAAVGRRRPGVGRGRLRGGRHRHRRRSRPRPAPRGRRRGRPLRCASSLEDLADLVAGARLVLSGDTGTAHLATAYAVPSVVLFGRRRRRGGAPRSTRTGTPSSGTATRRRGTTWATRTARRWTPRWRAPGSRRCWRRARPSWAPRSA